MPDVMMSRLRFYWIHYPLQTSSFDDHYLSKAKLCIKVAVLTSILSELLIQLFSYLVTSLLRAYIKNTDFLA